MKKSVSNKIASLLLAVLMLFTSTGFTVDLHFCQGELKSFSFFGEAESCHTQTKSCPLHANMTLADESKKDCCSNETLEVAQLDTDFDIVSDVELLDLQFEILPPSSASSISYASPSREEQSTFIDNQILCPALDIYVLLERFLI